METKEALATTQKNVSLRWNFLIVGEFSSSVGKIKNVASFFLLLDDVEISIFIRKYFQ